MTESELLDLLAELNTGERYYQYCDTRPRAKLSLSLPEQKRAIEATGLGFRYDAREKFFAHRVDTAHGPLSLHLAFSLGSLEVILGVGHDGKVIGGPLHVLALKLARRREPEYRHDPPYPRLPLQDEASVSEAIQFALVLHDELRAKLQA
ncbi:MAG: hypothetical protein ABW352_11540 [Polyangiales bacterium]